MFGKSGSLDTPRLVSVETTSHCNAKCVFCPNSALTRDKGPMAQALFEKIIDECRGFPLPAIEPFLQGDPFSDPDILERLELIRRRLPETKLRLYTNGHGMAPRQIDALLGLGIDHLYVSVNTLDAEKYYQVMGIALQRTLDNLAYLTEPSRRSRAAKKITFRMTRLGDTTAKEQDDFKRYCKDRGVGCLIVGLFNYKGDIASALPVPGYGCEHTTRLDILASGRVTLCCMDQDGEHGWADLNEVSVLEAFNHPTARRYRELHRAGKRRALEPCGTCNNFWPGFHGLSPLEAARTGIEYWTYLTRHRPHGRGAPRAIGPTGDGLVQLRRKHSAPAEPGSDAVAQPKPATPV